VQLGAALARTTLSMGHRARLIRWSGLVSAVLTCSTALAALAAPAADRHFALDTHWKYDAEGVALDGDRVAWSGTRMGGPAGKQRVVASRIFQSAGGSTVTTDFEGQCLAHAYSPAARLLLAVQIDPQAGTCRRCPARGVLIDAQGTVVTRLEYGRRTFAFSTSGQALVAIDPNRGRIDIHDLTGKIVRTLEPGPFLDALVLDGGSEAIVLDHGGLRRVGENGQARWSHALPTKDDVDGSLSHVPLDGVHVLFKSGAWMVLDFTGVVLAQGESGGVTNKRVWPLQIAGHSVRIEGGELLVRSIGILPAVEPG
jgi:hypothetical protein